jgi:radical SAM protein with 4Fe4S-binding SPASM domain
MNLNELPGDAPLPDFVQIEPVGQCNLACRMCPVVYRHDGNDRHKPPAFMSFETFTRLLDQFEQVRELHLQGLGEPLLHPRFFDMVRYAAARGIEVSTNTNLTALSERRAQQCVQSGLCRMHVSLDAADASAYEYIRVGSRLSWVLRNLSRLNEAKRLLNSPRPEIELVAVVMRRNLEQLPALVRLADQYGVRTVSVQHLCHDFSESSLPAQYRPMRAFVDTESLAGEEPERVERAFAAARAAAQELGVSLRLPRTTRKPQTEQGKPRCDWPWKGAYLSYSGQAMPCCMVATPDRVNFGSMEKEGVAQIWSNESYRRFRSELASDSPPEICRGCAVYNGTF